VLDLRADLGTPASADHAQVRPLGKLILRGEKLLMGASHDFLQAQFHTAVLQEKGNIGKELGSEKAT